MPRPPQQRPEIEEEPRRLKSATQSRDGRVADRGVWEEGFTYWS